MSELNLDDPEIYRLAALLAERRHTTMTAVVHAALVESEATDRPAKATVEQVLRTAQLLRAELAAHGEEFGDIDDVAVEHARRLHEGLAAVADWEAENGAFTEEEVREADARVEREQRAGR